MKKQIPISNGARQVERTVNGIGERAGNAALKAMDRITKARGKLMD